MRIFYAAAIDWQFIVYGTWGLLLLDYNDVNGTSFSASRR